MKHHRLFVAALPGAVALWAGSALAAPTPAGGLVNPLVEPVACENCHRYDNPLAQQADPAYSPFRTWQGTLMANAARDPVFWAAVAVADEDLPGETVACVRCHAPRAFLDGDGDATAITDLTFDQQAGVECELCHRAIDDGVTAAGNAMYTIDDVVIGTNVPRRGPWDYSDGVPDPPHSFITDPFLGTSRQCGTCHDVTTPAERVDDDGVGLGVPFNEQRTYSEWLGSAYAVPGKDFRGCQDCHMPAVADMSGCTVNVNQHSHPTGGRRHDLAGANRFMIELIMQEYGSAGSNQISDSVFELALARIDEFLPTAATLEVEAPTDVDVGVGLGPLLVTVTNNTGHKLPSGYSEGRMMWIEVVGEYAGEVVFSSGRWNQETGLERDPLMRSYQAIAEDFADGTTLHLLRNNHWVEDTRIPPLGLRPDLETDPVGDRYALLPDGSWPNFDQVAYDFDGRPDVVDATPDDATDDSLVVTVRLQYLINTPEYIDFLAEAGGQAGIEVASLFDAAGGALPLVLAEQTLTVPIVGFGGGTTGTSGSSDGDTSGTTSGTTTGSGLTTDLTSGVGTSDAGSGETTAPAVGGDDGGGCGCRSRGSTPALLWLFVFVALPRRRCHFA